jgi:SagB-type dehydrogenase family enzyme
MDKRGRAAAQDYLRLTFDDMADLFAQGQGREGLPGEPSRFLIYRDVPRERLPRPPAVPPRLGSDPPERLLSALFGYGYGLSGLELGPGQGWPYHRFVASARCLFPTEVYAWLPDGGSERIVQYDPAHHDLCVLREGPARAVLERALGRVIPRARAVLMVASYFWKTAFRYHDYAYRLCAQEAGMVTGNLSLVAGELGYGTEICYEFLDGDIRRLLDLPGEVSATLAIVTLNAPGEETAPAAVGTGGDQPDPAARPHGMGVPAPGRLPLTRNLEQLSERSDPSEFTGLCAKPPVCEDEPIPIPPEPPWRRDTFAALRLRHSGHPDFMPGPGPLSDMVLHAVHRAVLRPAVPFSSAYLAVNRVAGVRPGVYRCCSTCGGLHRVRTGAVGMRMQYAIYAPNVNAQATPLVVYLACDADRLIELAGGRAYRLMNLDAGVMAQRLSVAAAAHRCVARVSNGYHTSRVRELLRLPGTAVPVFQVLVANPRPGIRYRFPIVTGGMS